MNLIELVVVDYLNKLLLPGAILTVQFWYRLNFINVIINAPIATLTGTILL